VSFRFQFRRGTTAERDASNPILAAGEPAVVLDSGQPAELVLGDGVTAMADLRAAVWDDDARLALADTATQPGDLGTAAAADVGDFATAAQGTLADSATQPGDLGTAAAADAEDFATAEQGAKADTAVQPARLATLRASSLQAWGHSYIDNVVVDGRPDASIALYLADTLGLPLVNHSAGGTTLFTHVGGAAAWPGILQGVTRPNRFVSPGGITLAMYGVNDLNFLGNGVGDLGAFRSALTAAVSRFRAGAIFENDDATVTLTGSWGTNSATTQNSGSSYSYSTTVGDTITITTPADFPGGTIALGFVQWSDGGGALIQTTIGGVEHSFNTASFAEAGFYTCSVMRVPNVPAGAASHVFTVAAVTGGIGAVFDYWQWEPDEADAPLVVLLRQPQPLDYTAYGAIAPGPPTDAGVDALNATISAIAQEFDGRVLAVDTSIINKDPTCWIAGNVHPNSKGHRIMAELASAAIAATGLRVGP